VIIIKNYKEIEKIKRSCHIVAELLKEMEKMIEPGITTKELDEFAEDFIRKRKAIPAFKGYRDYPASICASINDVIVHGIPNSSKLKEGDIIGIDVGVLFDGYYGDTAATFPVGKVEDKHLELLKITKEALYIGIEKAKLNNRIGDISFAIQSYVEKRGFNVIRDFVGHGIGKNLHEEPKIPNFGQAGSGPKIVEGMVLAIEPMVSEGSFEIEIMPDGWTAKTKDRSYSAHFEHTIAITSYGTIILTELSSEYKQKAAIF